MADRTIGRYTLDRKILRGNPTRGVPDLWQAHDAGDVYYMKLWPKRADESSAIRALWNREVRGLMRLHGYPGAGEFFVRLRDLDLDEKYYYAVLDGGRRMLLSEVLANRIKYPWLSNLSEVGRKRPIWEGLLRVAEAISILHAEGTLHRSICTSAVFVGPEGHGDFRLSGFEWSLRFAGLEGAASEVAQHGALLAPELAGAEGEYSPGTDWFDFGVVAAEIFGVPVAGLKKIPAVQEAIKRHAPFRERERRFVLSLLEPDLEQRLSNSDEALQEIRNIIRDLNVATASMGRDLVLAIRLSDSNLSQLVQKASEGAAPLTDPLKQREWIKYDLRGDVRVIARLSPFNHFIIKGEKLEYQVKQWSVGSINTWDIGFCEAIESLPRVTADDQHFSIGERKIDVQLYPSVRKHERSIRDRSAQWNRVFPFRTEKAKLPYNLRDIWDFFRITQQLDTVLTVAQICPVNVIDVHRSSSDTWVQVTPIEEAERSELAAYLKLPSPAEQLRDWFGVGAEPVAADDDDDPKSDRYSFLDRRTIGSDPSATLWRFVQATPHKSGPRYRFRAQGALPVREGRLYLARNHDGTLAQIRRRHKAIEGMRSHEALLRMLAAPREVSRVSLDTLPSGTSNIEIDPSKMDALEALWKTQPSFAIQGPPGTGKTTLIKAFADRLFTVDHSAQILVTAHSHHTVDDVRHKLAGLFSRQIGYERPILLRIGANAKTEHDVEAVTSSLLKDLSESEVVRKAPAYLKARITAATETNVERGSDADVDVRTLQALVQDAANITFSTSNAGDLADLAARGRRFDWSIIEEAGKAHGFDMAIALQESHRLLFLGDHHQLPPFNAIVFKTLLGEPLRIRKAIQTGAQFAPGLIDPSLVEEEDGREPFEDRCNQWRRMVTLFAAIFENSVTEEGELGPAATLTDQHRMHPDIAELVGKVFYPDTFGGTILRSPQETHDKFNEPPPFRIIEGSWLPDARVVWCDVPWVQKEEFSEGEIEGLFVSKAEVEMVLKVLTQLKPNADKPCEIQILSPYNNQLDEIRNAINRAKSKGQLPDMFREPFDISKGKRVGATVDEFQGSEADVVIVSLVRNNALVPWKSVGFLKEANRMNVLLSRARQKLCIVGSWDFFETRCNEHTSPDDEHAYIGRMMKRMREAMKAGRLAKVDHVS
jgi:serine/threonine protein kinase